jgi:ankyrin repeat protein
MPLHIVFGIGRKLEHPCVGRVAVFLFYGVSGLLPAYPNTIDQRTLQEETALYLATCREHLDCLLSLLQAGAEPDISNKSRETPLYKGDSLGWASPGKS